MNLNDLHAAANWVTGKFYATTNPVAEALVEWAKTTLERIRVEMDKLIVLEGRDARLNLPAPSDDVRSPFVRLLRSEKSTGGDALVQLIEASARCADFRLLRIGDGVHGGILQHRRTMPVELQNCLVLDAGAEIDELAALDDDIRLAHESLPDIFTTSPASVKDWSEVEVWRMPAPGGKGAMRAQFGSSKSDGDSWAPRAVAEFVRDRCPAEGDILICTFKADGRADYRRRLEEELTALKVDVSRIKWTHWGAHDASNLWQDAVAVIAAGVWNLDRLHATAWAMGQMNRPDDLIPTKKTVSRILDSWVATSLYQLAGRGCARQMKRGKAKPMVFAYIHRRVGHAKYLRRIMPGAREYVWPAPPGATPVRDGMAAQVAREIVMTLEKLLAEGVKRISTRKLRVRMGLRLSKDVFTDAVAEALNEAPWVRESRTLVHAMEIFGEPELIGSES